MRNQKGLTLVEILVTSSIIIILSAIVVPNYLRYIRSAEVRGATSDTVTLLKEARVTAIRNGSSVLVEFFKDHPDSTPPYTATYTFTEMNCTNTNVWRREVTFFDEYGKGIDLLIVTMQGNPPSITFNSRGTLNGAATVRVAIQNQPTGADKWPTTRYLLTITPMGDILSKRVRDYEKNT